jgi:EpsI family protein
MRLRALVLFAVFTLCAVLLAGAARSEVMRPPRPLADLPMSIGEWRGRPQAPFDDKTLGILGVDDYVTRVYMADRAGVGLYVGYWGSQQQGDTIHSPLNCLPGAGWEPVSKSLLQIALPAGHREARRIAVNRYVVQKGLDRQLVLYWYQSHGRVVASEYASKVYLVTDAIRLGRTDAALVRVTVPISNARGGEAGAEQDATAFVGALFPALDAALPL